MTAATFLTEALALSQGEELCAIARIDKERPGRPRSWSPAR